MFAVLTLALSLQQASIRIGGSDKPKGDSARIRRDAIRDSIRIAIDDRRDERWRRTPRRIPLTPELERSAFLDAGARTLLLWAREARLKQDSSLLAYDAKAYQRVSVGLGFRAVGRDRLLLRTENASRVQWSRANGAHIDLTGRRTVFPMMKEVDGDAEMNEMSPIPYYPGREALWIGSGTAKAEVDEGELVHPIALGAEAYYRYATGDSLTITLSDGKSIQLRELRIEPRRPEWKLSVGSFWFDVSSGQLVRAVYRLAVPIDIWGLVDEETKRERDEAKARGRKPQEDDDVPVWVKGMMTPMQAHLEAVTIEYGLYGGRFWMPRAQYAEGWARASFMRIPFKIEESFKYASVNGTDSVPPMPKELTRRALRDSLFGPDSTPWRDLAPDVRKVRETKLAEADSVRHAQRTARRVQECASTGYYTTVETRHDNAVRAAVRMPCDTTVLAKSKDLPPSIFDPGDELFGTADRDELLKSLDFSLQAGWAPQRIALSYGASLWRYNRIEGFSSGASVSQQLGRGYVWDASVRLGAGDWHPQGETGLGRSDGRHSWRVGAYHRLAVDNDDWGSPLSFGASLGALLYGRDEAYYYRATGVDFTRTLNRGGGFTSRTFFERQTGATADVGFNLARAFGGGSRFPANLAADRVSIVGQQFQQRFSRGLDPDGWRVFGDARLEGGWLFQNDGSGTQSASCKPSSGVGTPKRNCAYYRLAGDATVTRGLGDRLAISLTGGAGVSGNAPSQRQFFLGGAQTVRGQLFGTKAGDAYWLGRAELGAPRGIVRPVLFGDLGWAGDRARFGTPGRPLSGAGVGASFVDGLIRVDLSRGIYPRKKMRLDLYVEGRF